MEADAALLQAAPSDEDASAQNLTSFDISTPTLSKSAQKRARKAAYFEERKLERRAREKEAKKEKKRKLVERVAAGETLPDEDGMRKKAKSGPKIPFAARVVVDLGFADKMSDKARPSVPVGYRI